MNSHSPLIIRTSVLGAGAHGQAASHATQLYIQKVVGAFTGVTPPPVAEQTQVGAASIVHCTGVGHWGGEGVRESFRHSMQLGKHRPGIV